MVNEVWAGAREKVLFARRRMAGDVRVTPLVESATTPGLHHKLESLQVTGSFKLRAALNQLLLLSGQERERGVVTSSSGNFAQAVAFAARRSGVSAKIVMMPSASPLKVERTRQWGAVVVFCEDRFEARQEMVSRIEREEGRAAVHPYDHPDAVLGNATAGLEILDQLPEVHNVVVPVSGGGLISGILLGLAAAREKIRVWGVQPGGSNATALSFRSGQRLSIERADTIADGLTVTRPGRLTFPLIQRGAEDVVTVKEESIRRAVRHYLLEERLVVEPSGAVPLAAVLEERVPVDRTVLLVSGGNIPLPSLLNLAGD